MATSDWPISRLARAIRVAVASIAWAFVDILTYLSHQAWAFIDIPTHVSMALDRLGRIFAVLSERSTAFTAFMQRALKHPSYTAGHFDPGRMPA